MPIQSVVIKVNGSPLVVSFDTNLQAYVATLPTQAVDFYNVEVDATDMASATSTLITFLSIAQGEIAKFQVNTSTNTPVPDVKITAYYRNPVGGANNGKAEVQTTDETGAAYLHLNPGSYNVTIEKVGFATKVISNFQVLSGINVFDGPGPIPHTHSVRAQDGSTIEDVSVKIEDMTLDPDVRLIAHRKTDAMGVWSANLPENRPLLITFEKTAFDFQKVGVQNA